MHRRISTLAALVAAILLPGCYRASPTLFSSSVGTFVYESTTMRPVTITVVDIRTEEPVFRMDVPVGQQFSMNFQETGGDDPVLRPAKMTWGMWALGSNFGSLENALSVPGKHARRIEYTLRQAPEYAPQPPQSPMRAGVQREEWETDEGGPADVPNRDKLYK
jgi:hypothetical protein